MLRERYARMETYADEGVARVRLSEDTPPVELTFETSYAAPSLLRFAFTSHHPSPPLRHVTTHHVVGHDGTRSYSWSREHDGSVELWTVDSLSLAVAGATGISHGTAHTISRLLLPEVGGFGLTDLQAPTVVGEEGFDDVPCLRIAGLGSSGGRRELLVERESLLLRAVFTRVASMPCEELRRRIRVNRGVEADRFAVPSEA